MVIELGTLLKILSIAKGLILKICSFWDRFSWVPSSPLLNPDANNDIKNYPIDFKLDFKNHDSREDCTVNGQDSFLQSLSLFINSQKGTWIIDSEYGNEQAYTIFKVENPTEFKRQCEYMAKSIISHTIYKNYIQQIYSIKRKKDYIYIEIKLNGIPETVTCKVKKPTIDLAKPVNSGA